MSSRCRPTTGDDQERVIDFLTRTFSLGRDAPFVNPALMRWKYWDPRPDFSEPRSLVIEKDESIVAHAGIWPVTISRSGGIERGMHMMDWASDVPGAGLSLVQRFTRTFDFVYAIGGTQMTQTILPKFGFRSECETLTWARPLRPVKQIVHHQARDIRLVPRLARNAFWSVQPPRRPDPRWAAVRATPAEAATVNAVNQERDADFFSYIGQYFGSRCLMFRITFEGRSAGFFLLVVAGLQARFAGAWLENASEEGWRIAFELAQEAALRETGACELIARGSGVMLANAAEESGMRLRGRAPVFLYRKAPADPLPLRFQLCDNDSFFLGGDEFLT